jgi:hypothetical protein
MENFIVYIIAGACCIAAIASIITFNPYLIAITPLLGILFLILFKGWNIIEALLFKHTHIIQMFDGFELSGSRLTAVAREGGIYTSVSAAELVPTSNSEIDRDKLERLIRNFGFPFRLSTYVKRFKTDKIIEKLQVRRKMKEIELSRIHNQKSGTGMLKAARLKEEISCLNHELSQIQGGGVPLEMRYYVVTASSANLKYKADEEALSNLKEVLSGLNAILGTESAILSGPELIKMIKFDYVMQ